MRLAEKADPLSSEIHRALAYVLPSAGRYDEAAGDCEKGVTPGSEVRAFLGYAYARTGRRALAEKMAIGTNPFNQAVIFAGLGTKGAHWKPWSAALRLGLFASADSSL